MKGCGHAILALLHRIGRYLPASFPSCSTSWSARFHSARCPLPNIRTLHRHSCRERNLCRRIGRGDCANRRGADRTGDQWRRQHDLRGVAVDWQRRRGDQRRVQAGNQHRSSPGSGAYLLSIALPRLPEEGQRIGVTVRKSSPDPTPISITLPDGSLDQQYISNYASINIKDVITVYPRRRRYHRVRCARLFYAGVARSRQGPVPRAPTASDVVTALRAANVQVAAGAINEQPPATSPGGFEVAVQTLGRLSEPGPVQRDRCCHRPGRSGDGARAISRGSSSARRTTRPMPI